MNTFFDDFDITSQKSDKTTKKSNSPSKETNKKQNKKNEKKINKNINEKKQKLVVILRDSMLLHINGCEISKILQSDCQVYVKPSLDA